MPPRKSTARAESPARSPARAKRVASPSRTRATSKSRARAAPKEEEEPVKPAKKTTVKKSTAKKNAKEEDAAPTKARSASKARAAKEVDAEEEAAPKRGTKKSTNKKAAKDEEAPAKKSASKKAADTEVEAPTRGRKSTGKKVDEEPVVETKPARRSLARKVDEEEPIVERRSTRLSLARKPEEEEPVVERRPARRSLARKADEEEEEKQDVAPRRSTRGRSILPADEAKPEEIPVLHVRTRSRSGARLPALPVVTPVTGTGAVPVSPLDATIAGIASDVYGGMPISPITSTPVSDDEEVTTEVTKSVDFPFSSFLPAFAVSVVLALTAAFFPVLNASAHSAAVFRQAFPFLSLLRFSALRTFTTLELTCISTFLAALHVLVLNASVPAKASPFTRHYAAIAARGVAGVAVLALYAHLHLHYAAHTATNLVYLYIPVLALSLAHLFGNFAVNGLPFSLLSLMSAVIAYPIVFTPTSSPLVPHLALAMLPFVVSNAAAFLLISRATAPFPTTSSLYPFFSVLSSVCAILFLVLIVAGPAACLYYSYLYPAHTQHVSVANALATGVLITGNVLAYITATAKQ